MEETPPPLLLLSRRRGDRLAIRRSDKLNQLTHLPRRVLPPRLMIFKSSQSRRFTILSSTWLQLQRERERDDDSFTIFFTIFSRSERCIFDDIRPKNIRLLETCRSIAESRRSIWCARSLFFMAGQPAFFVGWKRRNTLFPALVLTSRVLKYYKY